jgi:replicative DNA helicase
MEVNEQLKQIDKELKMTEQEINKIRERKRILECYEDYQGEDRVITFRELAKELKKQKPSEGYYTQIPKLDKKTEGFRDGNLIIVSGTTGSGKTSLLQTFTKNFSNQELSTLFFTYEVPPREFLRKFENDIPEFACLPKQHHASKLEWLEQRIIEAIAKYQTKIIMIDHLHFLLDMKMMSGNTSLFIGGIMRELKRIAIEYDIIIFLVAHTKKTKFNQDDEMPELTSLRDSGMIACEADFVIFIDRKLTEDKKEWDNKAMLYLAKNRWSGDTGWIPLIYSNNKFNEEQKNDNTK